MSSIEIIDNFLNDYEFEHLKKLFLHCPPSPTSTIPWYYADTVVTEDDDNPNNYGFGHMIYIDNEPVSQLYPELNACLAKLNIFSLIRIKANLSTKADKKYVHGFHIDCPNIPDHLNSKTSILYMNTTNGPTAFENGDEVECIANRMVIFDSRMAHSSTTCTDQKSRVVINFNYF